MALIYSRSALGALLPSISLKPLKPALWHTLTRLGISRARPTRRGCRSGSRKQRPISTCVGFGRLPGARNLQSPARNRNADSEDDGNLHIFPQDILNIHLDASRRNSTIDLIVIDRSPLSAAIQDSASQPLMLCSVNVRSAKSKSADFLDYIHTSGADLFAFTETWLTANDTAAKLELIPPETHNFVHHNRSGRKVGELVCSSDKTLA